MDRANGETRKRTANRSLAGPSGAGERDGKRARVEGGCAHAKASSAAAAAAAAPTSRTGAHQWISDGCRLGPPATYNKYLSVMATMRTLGMKEKRELFKLMREGDLGKCGRVTEHTFIPHLGVTMGEFALFYVLNDDPRAPS
ncbi:hypothetical protein pkur_cds_217 [Pandoravirus kuranda]|uniref:Cyclic nucleotide-binding domain-containing protein n=2 Tax=Pandoravirus TaxID=2060084 RepID=A0AA95ECT6_9VIRU|nr:hypothetical protein pneo_cds_241 [Pandoravirus neocaledonia]AVK75848.1 hypothetical protein pneo_cds_241 [Pandoravirus neocaledonia]WBR14392.1 hypothetical protein pkur_cds_217 [Pandoravirus kuranda]